MTDETKKALEAAVKALEFYADPDKYKAIQRLQYIPAEVEEDRGRRAGRALALCLRVLGSGQ